MSGCSYTTPRDLTSTGRRRISSSLPGRDSGRVIESAPYYGHSLVAALADSCESVLTRSSREAVCLGDAIAGGLPHEEPDVGTGTLTEAVLNRRNRKVFASGLRYEPLNRGRSYGVGDRLESLGYQTLDPVYDLRPSQDVPSRPEGLGKPFFSHASGLAAAFQALGRRLLLVHRDSDTTGRSPCVSGAGPIISRF